jgi:hypothetical protein
MKKYIYRSPEEDGYKRVQFDSTLHNTLFPRQKIRWCDRYEYFLLDEGERADFRFDRFTGILGILVLVLVYPLNLLMSGLGEFKQVNKEYRGLFRQHETGSFSSMNTGDKETLDIIRQYVEYHSYKRF